MGWLDAESVRLEHTRQIMVPFHVRYVNEEHFNLPKELRCVQNAPPNRFLSKELQSVSPVMGYLANASPRRFRSKVCSIGISNSEMCELNLTLSHLCCAGTCPDLQVNGCAASTDEFFGKTLQVQCE